MIFGKHVWVDGRAEMGGEKAPTVGREILIAPIFFLVSPLLEETLFFSFFFNSLVSLTVSAAAAAAAAAAGEKSERAILQKDGLTKKKCPCLKLSLGSLRTH